MEKIDRKPAVSGQFYPAQPEKLKQELKNLFSEAAPRQCQHVRAIISPHAGYVFSGKTAASAFNQIEGKKKYKRIFILGSSHHEQFDAAAVYCDGDFLMPYGTEKVDMDFGRKLVEDYPTLFTSFPSPHQKEHSLEVQLPFLHHVVQTEYCIVPIILGASNPEFCQEIARVLKPWLNSENLFIISTDFSHYPEYGDAKEVDRITKNAILTNDPQNLLSTLRLNAQKHIPHLATSLCGWTSVLTLLYMTTGNENMEYYAIDYSNSGDTHLYGDPDRVVGYWGIAVSEEISPEECIDPESTFELTESDRKTLLELARKTLEEKIRLGKTYPTDPSEFSSNLKANCGAFVSLHIGGQLRGCIGRMIGDTPLYHMVQEMAVSAALHDPRFSPVTAEELTSIELELSILSPLQKISDYQQIKLGKHGILVASGRHSGVFLPQVATETGWNLEEFLGHCSQDKAGLGWNGWKTADLYIFTADVFGEKKEQ